MGNCITLPVVDNRAARRRKKAADVIAKNESPSSTRTAEQQIRTTPNHKNDDHSKTRSKPVNDNHHKNDNGLEPSNDDNPTTVSNNKSEKFNDDENKDDADTSPLAEQDKDDRTTTTKTTMADPVPVATTKATDSSHETTTVANNETEPETSKPEEHTIEDNDKPSQTTKEPEAGKTVTTESDHDTAVEEKEIQMDDKQMSDTTEKDDLQEAKADNSTADNARKLVQDTEAASTETPSPALAENETTNAATTPAHTMKRNEGEIIKDETEMIGTQQQQQQQQQDTLSEEKHSFRFLSGTQILQLKSLSARQLLPFDTTALDPTLSSSSRSWMESTNNVVANDDDNNSQPPQNALSSAMALAFVFVSHRWMEAGNPDTNGQQLKALQIWLRYVKELLHHAIQLSSSKQPGEETQQDGGDDKTSRTISWPSDLNELTEGMPQAAALVSRILAGPELEWKLDQIAAQRKDAAAEINLLDHVWIWYDCACLPQKFGRPVGGRTAQETAEFGWALQRLDQLARNCKFLYLTSKDYFQRAWCAFEHYQSSLNDLQGHIVMDCEQVIEGHKVQWKTTTENDSSEKKKGQLSKIKFKFGDPAKAKDDKEGSSSGATDAKDVQNGATNTAQSETTQEKEANPKPTRYPDAKYAGKEVVEQMKEAERLQQETKQQDEEEKSSRKKALQQERLDEFDKASSAWKALLEDTPSSGGSQNGIDSTLAVPDLQVLRVQLEVSHSHETGQAPGMDLGIDATANPLVQSMTLLVRELYTAVFSMSCRDAQNYANRKTKFHDFYHGPSEYVPGEFMKPYSNMCCDDVGIQCGLHDHRQVHGPYQKLKMCTITSPKDVQIPRSIDPRIEPMCERRVTIDFFELANAVLSRFNLKCTNSGDVAFVGLMALRNILSANNFENDNEANSNALGANAWKVSAGSLRLLSEPVSRLVETYSHLIALGADVTKLVASIIIQAPRWVHLDLAFTAVEVNEHVVGGDLGKSGKTSPFRLTEKVQSYLLENPDCISIELDTTETPLTHIFCRHNKFCHSGWCACKHTLESRVLLKQASAVSAAGSLDPWGEMDLPEPRACFPALVANNFVYVVGGAKGNADLFGNYISCSPVVYRAEVARPNQRQRPHVDLKPFVKMEESSLRSARRNHAGAVRVDPTSGNAISLIVSGGRGNYEKGGGKLLSSCEVLSLEKGDDDSSGDLSWNDSLFELPYARSAHHSICFEDCLFVTAGRTKVEGDGLTKETQKCHIFDVRSSSWKDGPDHPLAFAGGSSLLIENRFWCLLGGVKGKQFMSFFSVLDLKPWAKWIADGCEADKRPKSTWMRGPDLPIPMASPNACVARRQETGSGADWIVLVAPMRNFCYGMMLQKPVHMQNENLQWNPKGILYPDPPGSKNARFFQLEWKRMGATPDGFSNGSAIATHGFLAMIGGEQLTKKKSGIWDTAAENTIYYRDLRSMFPFRNTILPNYDVDKTAPSIVKVANQNIIDGKFIAAETIELNDRYLVGRLGFSISDEPQLVVQDKSGTKKLSIVERKPGLQCLNCMAADPATPVSSVIEQDTAPLYALYGTKRMTHLAKREDALKILCSQCLCNWYYLRAPLQEDGGEGSSASALAKSEAT